MPRHSPGLGFANNGWGSVSVVWPVYSFILIIEPSPGSLRGLVKPLAKREGTPKLFARRVTAQGRDVISPLLNNFCWIFMSELQRRKKPLLLSGIATLLGTKIIIE